MDLQRRQMRGELSELLGESTVKTSPGRIAALQAIAYLDDDRSLNGVRTALCQKIPRLPRSSDTGGAAIVKRRFHAVNYMTRFCR
ncbi:MAG: hypothetical protein ABEH86_00295 [Haloarcula sp.]